MNNVVETIIKRRSCKSFSDEPVSQEIIDQIVEAGLYAPSAMNNQPIMIVEVTNKEIVKNLSKLNAKYDPKKRVDPFYNCYADLIVLANKDVTSYMYDGPLAMENMLIAAEALGVGACWIHRAKEMFEDEEGRELLRQYNIPDNYEGIGNCVIGVPKVKPEGLLERKCTVVKIK